MRTKLTALLFAVAAAVLVGGPAGPAGAVAGSAKQKLTISPAKGTPNASAETQISLLGVHPEKIKSVELTGDLSGEHPGQMRSYSGNRGASFLPDQPLTEGERAEFTVRIKGRDPISSWFTVGISGLNLPFLPIETFQQDKLRHYQSEPDLVPPKITVEKNSHKTKGDLFLTPLPSPTVHPEATTR